MVIVSTPTVMKIQKLYYEFKSISIISSIIIACLPNFAVLYYANPKCRYSTVCSMLNANALRENMSIITAITVEAHLLYNSGEWP